MQSFAPGRLAKADEPQLVQALAQFARPVDHGGEFHIRGRIEVEDQPARQLRLAGPAIPRVELEGTDLGQGGQAFDLVDLQIGFGFTGDLHAVRAEFDMPGMAWRWKNCWPAMPSGQRRMEQGRPLRWGIIQPPTAS